MSATGGHGGGTGGASSGSGGTSGTTTPGDAGGDRGGDSSTDGGASDASANDAGVGRRVCGSADEDGVATLSCPAGQIIDRVLFASLRHPAGECENASAGSCDAMTSVSVVEDLCVGRASCMVPASNGAFGDPCHSTVKRLAVAVQCAPGTPIEPMRPFKGVANSPCAARTALNVSWYYNWEQTETEPCTTARAESSCR